MAASATWSTTAATSAWQTGTNWGSGTAAGDNSGLGTVTDAATFNASTITTVLPDANRTIGTITFGSSAGSYTIGSAAGNALYLGGGGAGTTADNGTGAINDNVTGANVTITFAGPIVLLRNQQFIASATQTNSTMKITGSVTNNGSVNCDFQLKGTNIGLNEVSGTVSDGSSFATTLTKLNAGSWIVSGANTFTGRTAISQGSLSVATLNHIAAGTLGGSNSPAASSSLGRPTTTVAGTIALGSVANSGTLIYTGTGETTDRILNLAGSTGGGTIDQEGSGLLKFTASVTAGGAGSKTLTLTGSGNGELAGTIKNQSSSNTTSLLKTGSGTWTISGLNTAANTGFTGSTTISDGTLALGNASALAISSTIGVSGGTLSTGAGSYTLGGDLTLGSGTLTPGSTGVATLALAAGKAFSMTGGTWAETLGASSDSITGSGTAFSITGGTLDLAGSTINYASSYTLLSGFTSGSVSGLAITGFDTANYSATLSNAGVLSFTPTPEPAEAGILILGTILMGRRNRRRSHG